METPLIFVASESSARDRARPETGSTEALSFEPGMLGLHALCAIVSGQVMTKENSSLWLALIDGPPNPETDEGFHVYRIGESVTERLAALPDLKIDEMAARWHAAIEKLQGTANANERPVLVAVLGQMSNLARLAVRSGKSLFVEILNR